MEQGQKGRPRSESARRAILEATRDLLTDVGYEALSFQEIASMAGVGKQTVYRWWPSKPAIIAEAVMDGYLQLPETSIPNTGSLDVDLKQWLVQVTELFADPLALSIARALATATSEDEDDGVRLYGLLANPVRGALIERLEAGKAADQLRAEASVIAIADALQGAVLFRIIARLPTLEDPAGLVDVLVGTHQKIEPSGS